MDVDSFLARYSRRLGVIPAAFTTDLLFRSLPPHARPLVWLLGACDRQYFHADYEFIEDVSHLKSPADFWTAVEHYVQHPSNQGFLRRRLRLRISVRRMLAVVDHVFPEDVSPGLAALLAEQGTMPPFAPAPEPAVLKPADDFARTF